MLRFFYRRTVFQAAALAAVALIVCPSAAAAQTPQEAEQQALAAFQAGRLQEAYIALRPALEAEPERPDLWFLLGQIVAAMGQPERALLAYDSALTLAPDVPGPWFARGLALIELGRFDEASASLERCQELAPGQPQVARFLGVARLRSGDAAGALQALAATDTTAPDYGEVITIRTEALRTLGRENEAIDVATAYLETDEEYQPVRYELALSLIAADRTADGLVALRQAAVATPPFPLAVIEYAGALRTSEALEDQFEAAGLYRHSIDHFPADGAMRGELASLYAELGLEAEAGEEAGGIIEIAPDDPGALLLAGNVLLQVSRPADALAALESAAAIEPGDAMVQHHLGLALMELQRQDEALAAFDRALEIDAALLDTRIHAGRAALLIGAAERAVLLIEAAGPAAEEDSEAMAVLGEAYVETGRFEDAVLPLRLATELDPELGDAPYLLARAYRETGQQDLAREALTEFQSRAGQRAEAQGVDQDAAARYRLRLMRTRAGVYVAEGRFDEAMPILMSALTELPDDPELYDLIAAAHDGLGNAEQAAEARRRAAELRRFP